MKKDRNMLYGYPKYRMVMRINEKMLITNYRIEYRVEMKRHWWSPWRPVKIYPEDNMKGALDHIGSIMGRELKGEL